MGDSPAPGGADNDPAPRRGLIGGLVGRVAPTVIRQIDMDAVIAELDVNAIAEQLDLDALMDRLDMDALVDKLDVNAVADKLDLDQLMAKIDMAQMTAGVTQDVAASGLDLARRQLVRADAVVDGFVGGIIRRGGDDRPVAPAQLATDDLLRGFDDPDPEQSPRRREVSGHYAGPVTRLLALAGDLWAALTSFGVLSAVTVYLLDIFIGSDLTDGATPWVLPVLAGLWIFTWFWAPVALFGRTLAMAFAGLAVVRRDGSLVGQRGAFIRSLVQPVSLLLLGLGLIGMFIGRERRTLHDVAAGTVVVYDWGARQAEQPVSIREQLSARVSRRRTDVEYPPETLSRA